MELADMRDLGSRVARRVGSSPFIRTIRATKLKCFVALFVSSILSEVFLKMGILRADCFFLIFFARVEQLPPLCVGNAAELVFVGYQ